MRNMRKLLIFGNGLGMAIDPQHFGLANALQTVWNSYPNNDPIKTLMQNCIPTGQNPISEDELDNLHVAATSCNFLNTLQSAQNSVHWLNHHGKLFPQAAQQYIHAVATKLFNYHGSLPRTFVDPLIDFISKTQSHVATLNYDKLLYQEFINHSLCNGYHGTLVDGFYDSGFASSHMVRMYGNTFGYYMHLHGSPLFYDGYNGVTYKKNVNQINNVPSKHIVLTHIRHKPSVITASHVLSTYWNYLIHALDEVEEIVVFGYSGQDTHLNEILKVHAADKMIRVVEWNGAIANRAIATQDFWNGQLRNPDGYNHNGLIFNNPINVVSLPDITQFTSW